MIHEERDFALGFGATYLIVHEANGDKEGKLFSINQWILCDRFQWYLQIFNSHYRMKKHQTQEKCVTELMYLVHGSSVLRSG